MNRRNFLRSTAALAALPFTTGPMGETWIAPAGVRVVRVINPRGGSVYTQWSPKDVEQLVRFASPLLSPDRSR